MRHILFDPSFEEQTFTVLLKETAFRKSDIKENYVDPLLKQGVAPRDISAFTLKYNDQGKIPVSLAKEYLEELLPVLKEQKTKYLYVADSTYFKVLTKQTKAEPHFGYVLPCAIKGYEDMSVVLGVNYQSLFYNPDLKPKMESGLEAMVEHAKGAYKPVGSDIIHTSEYPESVSEIAAALNKLHQYPSLSSDIEAFSLNFDEAGVATIGFAWDQNNGIAFPVDYKEVLGLANGQYGVFQKNEPVRALLREFFETYKGNLKFHNCTYDTKVLIYSLWMKDALDMEGLLKGLHILHRDIDDTKIIAYLSLNSTARNSYSLKDLSQEFAGNYAMAEINDVRKIPLKDLLKYNLIDCLSTWFVYDKYYAKMVNDKQLVIYKYLMMPSQKVITQVELSGMPLNMETVKAKKAEMEAQAAQFEATIRGLPVIKNFNQALQFVAWEEKQASLKKKIVNLEDFKHIEFNPNSGPQLQKLLYETMQLPVLDLTDTKQPATGADTLEKLINHTNNQDYKDLLKALIGLNKVQKVLTAFVPAFEAAMLKPDGWHYLHGSFNLGGTVSGRLSSSNPNMQNIPAGSAYAKMIKEMFQAPEGWLFCGADFNALEDRISALTTKDPNKLKVYLDGYDSHSIRAFSYFGDQMPDIENTVESINTIPDKYSKLRSESKGPTFLLTYGGSWRGLVKNLGWDEDKAKLIEQRYHELYKVSDEYVAKRLEQAAKSGYVEVAFGLRVRTPLLGQVAWGSSKVPYEAQAEGRTAGNALGQSYGLLNNRACNAFMEAVWNSPYRYDIKPVAMIHDAIYIMVRDDVEVLEFANRELVKAMSWQDLPEIQHDEVKLGAQLDIFYPTWNKAVHLPIGANQEELLRVCKEHQESLNKK